MNNDIKEMLANLDLPKLDGENVYLIIDNQRDLGSYGGWLANCKEKYKGIIVIDELIVTGLVIEDIHPNKITDDVYILNEDVALKTLEAATRVKRFMGHIDNSMKSDEVRDRVARLLGK